MLTFQVVVQHDFELIRSASVVQKTSGESLNLHAELVEFWRKLRLDLLQFLQLVRQLESSENWIGAGTLAISLGVWWVFWIAFNFAAILLPCPNYSKKTHLAEVTLASLGENYLVRAIRDGEARALYALILDRLNLRLSSWLAVMHPSQLHLRSWGVGREAPRSNKIFRIS